MNQLLIDCCEQVKNQKVIDAMYRLAGDSAVLKAWPKLPSNAAEKLKTACIFYWESQGLPNKSTYAKEIDDVEKKVIALQFAMRTNFGLGDDALALELDRYRARLQTIAKEAYSAFYALPRLLLLERLYALTDNLSKPNHDLIATLASLIADEVISATDIQSSYRNLKLAKMQSKK